MSRRMLCTECFETAEPETRLAGSDRVELVAWLCLAVPGWIYCGWRHLERRKVCARCGSGSLIREARAAAAWAPPGRAAAVRSESGPLRWPRALATPRDRLRHGAVGAALACVGLWLALLGALPRGAPLDAGWLVAPALTLWTAFELVRIRRLRAPACAAWSDDGRPLPIEWIG